MCSKPLSAGSFAEMSRITSSALRYYDRRNLLTPIARGENNYRYYSIRQLSELNLIRIMQELGVPLDEIYKHKSQRTPESTSDMLLNYLEKIEERMDELIKSRKLLRTMYNVINSVSAVKEDDITVKFLPEEAIFMGKLNDYSQNKNDFEVMKDFYNYMQENYKNLDLNYPVWANYSESRIKRGDWKWPDRYYFFNPEGHDKRPAALYAIGYARGGYGRTDALYKKLIDYIDSNGFEIFGDAYEEYPLNELCVSDDDKYLIRVMITVREKKAS